MEFVKTPLLNSPDFAATSIETIDKPDFQSMSEQSAILRLLPSDSLCARSKARQFNLNIRSPRRRSSSNDHLEIGALETAIAAGALSPGPLTAHFSYFDSNTSRIGKITSTCAEGNSSPSQF